MQPDKDSSKHFDSFSLLIFRSAERPSSISIFFSNSSSEEHIVLAVVAETFQPHKDRQLCFIYRSSKHRKLVCNSTEASSESCRWSFGTKNAIFQDAGAYAARRKNYPYPKPSAHTARNVACISLALRHLAVCELFHKGCKYSLTPFAVS